MHSNESACRKKVRLGLEQVFIDTMYSIKKIHFLCSTMCSAIRLGEVGFVIGTVGINIDNLWNI